MDKFIGPDNLKFAPNAETIVAVALCIVLSIFLIIVGIIFKHADPTKRPKGIILLFDLAIEKLDNFVYTNMGSGFENFGGYLLGVILFLSSNFLIGLVGLPTPMTYLPIPLTLGLSTFVMIHVTSIRYTKWKYFKRYVEPFAVFLPVNLLSMWAPLLSLTLRLFGNALVGWVLLTLVNWALTSFSAVPGETFFIGIQSGQFVQSGNTFSHALDFLTVGVGTPLLHAYFDVFSTLIQTLVFISLTTLLIAQEKPDLEEVPTSLGSRKEI